MHTIFYKKLILISVILTILITPVFAITCPFEEETAGSFTNFGGVSTNTTTVSTGGSTNNGLGGIFFRNAQTFPMDSIVSINQWDSLSLSSAACLLVNSSFNSSSTNAHLTYNGVTVSTGTLYYNIDNSNHRFIQYVPLTWDPTGIPENVLLNLIYDRSEFNFCMNNYDGILGTQFANNLYAVAFTQSWAVNPLAAMGANVGIQYINYKNQWAVRYETDMVDDYLSTIYIIREFTDRQYYSRVRINETQTNGANLTVYDEWSVNDTTGSSITHYRSIYVDAWDNALNHYFTSFVLGPDSAILKEAQFNRFKGDSLTNTLSENEVTTVTFNSEQNPDNLKWLVWVWSKDRTNTATKIYEHNATTDKWDLDSNFATNYTWQEIKSQDISFYAGDYNTTWTNTTQGSGKNFVRMYYIGCDESNSMMESGTVYVGKQYDYSLLSVRFKDSESNANVIPDGDISVYDTTDGDLVLKNITGTTTNVYLEYADTYNIRTLINNYSVAYYELSWYGSSTPTIFDGDPDGYVTFNANWLGTSVLTAYTTTELTANNYTLAFKVVDEFNQPISNVKTTLDTGDIKYTNSNGLVSFSLPKDLYYTATFSKVGYADVTYKTQLTRTKFITISMESGGYTVTFNVHDQNDIVVPNAKVSIDTGAIGYTDATGAVVFTLGKDKTYTATFEKDYFAETTYLFYLDRNRVIDIEMTYSGEVPTETPTPGPGEPGYVGANLFDTLKSFLAEYLGLSLDAVNIMLGLFLIIGCVTFTGYYIRDGTAMMISAMAGYGATFALGLFPMWLLFFSMAIIVIYVVLKMRPGG